MAAPKALLSPSPHFRVAATPPDGSSLLCGTQPVSSLAHDTPDPPSLQSKCWPWPGGAATAAPAATRKHPPMTDPRSRFMRLLRWPIYERDHSPNVAPAVCVQPGAGCELPPGCIRGQWCSSIFFMSSFEHVALACSCLLCRRRPADFRQG